jgi:hypothetical protein
MRLNNTVSPAMGTLQKLGRYVVGGRDAIVDPSVVLREIYGNVRERVQRLRLHAELAPQEHGRQGLSTLAADAGETLEELRAALRERGVGLVPETKPRTEEASLNHWGRLVKDLEDHRASSRRLRELAMHLDDSHPAVAVFLNRLCNEDVRSCERLRDLIARADPQALD